MRMLSCVILFSIAGPAFTADKFAEDFRNAKFNDDLLKYSGLTPEKYITREKEGLRLHYTGEDAPPSNNTAGVVWKFHARGDFKVTAKYEILHVDPPTTGNGVGVELYLRLRNANKDGIAFARLVYPPNVSMISFNHMTDIDGKRRPKDPKRVETTERSLKGRFRIAREGTVLISSFAEADDEQFKEIDRREIGNVDINLIRFAGLAGGHTKAILDMRLLEFHLEGHDLGFNGEFATPAPKSDPPPKVAAPGNVAVSPPPAPDPPATPPRNNLLLLLIIFALLGVPLFACAAIVLFLRLRKPKVEAQKPAVKHSAPTSKEPRNAGEGVKTGATKPKTAPRREPRD